MGIPASIRVAELNSDYRQMIGRVHLVFMGGEYLPRMKSGEVDIARISIRSTTFDVTVMYARQVGWRTHNRMDAAAARWPATENADALADWVAGLDMKTFALLAAVSRWMDDEPDWIWESDYFSAYASGQSAALDFFHALPPDALTTLGVAIVEGEHRGSSYFAAELRIPASKANHAAKTIGLPIRFRVA